jgi:hypothetical protein
MKEANEQKRMQETLSEAPSRASEPCKVNNVSPQEPVLPSAQEPSTPEPSARKKATGPRTPKGKQSSRCNAVKHGIFSQVLLLAGEPTARYASLLNGLRQYFQPQGEVEVVLVDHLATVLWRKRRALQAENIEIQKAGFLPVDSSATLEVEALDYARPDGELKGRLKQSNARFIVQEAISTLETFRLTLEDSSRKGKDPGHLLRAFFGVAPNEGTSNRMLRSGHAVARLTAAYANATKHEPKGDEELLKVIRAAIDDEIARLYKIDQFLVALETARSEYNSLTAANVPCKQDSERLVRYEAHLSREVDRTLNQLERLQRVVWDSQ